MDDPGRVLAASVGRVIADLRRERGLTLDDLAARSDLHRTTIGTAERGVRHLTIASASRVATAFGLRLSDLVAMAERRDAGRRT